MSIIAAEVPSPFGPLTVFEKDNAIIAVDWEKPEQNDTSPLLTETARQMAAYFDGSLKDFDLPLKPGGNELQQSICKLISEIPYGETTTYGAIADKLETFGQVIGRACGMNTIPIIIPCHRVLAVNGIGGYSGDGGIERKIELLKHEGGFPFLI